MREQRRFSLVLIELVVVILFFALSATAILRMIAAADAYRRKSADETEAMTRLTDLIECVKADPEGSGLDASGIRYQEEQSETGLLCAVRVIREDRLTGAMYRIEAFAMRGGETVLTWNAAQYAPETEAGQ